MTSPVGFLYRLPYTESPAWVTRAALTGILEIRQSAAAVLRRVLFIAEPLTKLFAPCVTIKQMVPR